MSQWARIACTNDSGEAVARLPQARQGLQAVCVTEDGSLGSRLLGIVTARDTDFVNDRLTPLGDVMTTWVVPTAPGSTLWPMQDV